jgi:hypothetical protein
MILRVHIEVLSMYLNKLEIWEKENKNKGNNKLISAQMGNPTHRPTLPPPPPARPPARPPASWPSSTRAVLGIWAPLHSHTPTPL